MEKADKEIEKNKEEFEAKQNLIGFFDLLLKVDSRLHPGNYKKGDKQK